MKNNYKKLSDNGIKKAFHGAYDKSEAGEIMADMIADIQNMNTLF